MDQGDPKVKEEEEEVGATEVKSEDEMVEKLDDFVSVSESECVPEDVRETVEVTKNDWVDVLGHDRLRLKVHNIHQLFISNQPCL